MMSVLKLRAGLLVALAAAVCVGSSWACSTSSSDAPSACTPGGGSCGAGETCWPISSSGSFGCVAAGTAVFADSCENSLGVSTCAAGLTCDQPTGGSGTCTTYCGEGNACTQGYSCYQVSAGSSGVTLSRPSPDSGGFLGVNLLDGGNTDPGGDPGDGGIYVNPDYDANFDAGPEHPQ